MTSFEMKKAIVEILALEASKPVAYSAEELLKQFEEAKKGDTLYFVDEKSPPSSLMSCDLLRENQKAIQAIFENRRIKQITFIYVTQGFKKAKLRRVGVEDTAEVKKSE